MKQYIIWQKCMNKARKTKIIYKIRTTGMDFSLIRFFFLQPKSTEFTVCIWTNRPVDPNETPQNAAPHQGLHCLPLVQQFLDTTLDSK